jgi:hypothetical protein
VNLSTAITRLYYLTCGWLSQVEVGNHLVRLYNVSSGAISVLAGTVGATGSSNGVGSNALFNAPSGVAVDAAGTFALVVRVVGLGEGRRIANAQRSCRLRWVPVQTDYNGYLVRRIVISSGAVTTFAGLANTFGHLNGVGTSATFRQPWGVAMDAAGAVALVVSFVVVEGNAEKRGAKE